MKALSFFSRSFFPYFVTQALGALNDNLLKNIIVTLMVFGSLSINSSLNEAMLVNVCAGLFILPFVLFSGLAGELGARFEKSAYIQSLKWMELAIVALAAWALAIESVGALLWVIFLLGLQATLYGPVKYAYLPERVKRDDLTKANSWVEASTFLCILLGTLAAGLIVHYTKDWRWYAAGTGVLAAAGLTASFFVPGKPISPRCGKSSLNPWSATVACIAVARKVPSVHLSILGISSFWAIGSIILANLPPLAKQSLRLDELGLTLLLALFSFGVAAGSLAADKISGKRLEIGIVPLASLLLAIAIYQMYSVIGTSAHSVGVGSVAFFDHPGAMAFGRWLFVAGFAGGAFGVPLYTLVQMRCAPQDVERTMSFNNFQNALFMVAGAAGSALLLNSGASLESTLLLALAVNVVACAVVFRKIPEFAFRLVVLLVARAFYRIDVKNHEIVPHEGACILVGNHVTWIDSFILSASCRRPAVYVMWWKLMEIPVVGWFFLRVCKAIPIAGRSENPHIYHSAFSKISAALRDGQLVCIFPEGALTYDGEMAPFKNGVFKMLEADPVPLYAFGMEGVWGTFFSRKHRRLGEKLKVLRFRHRIGVRFAKVDESVTQPEQLRDVVAGLIEVRQNARPL